MSAYPASMIVREAIDDFLARYGFSRDECSARTYWIALFGLEFRLPNPRSRRVMVPLHDLHHIATGYEADWRGEVRIGAWELRAGCTTAMLWLINGVAAILGLVIAPKDTWHAFRTGAEARSLYRMNVSYAAALDLTVGELRARIGVPQDGIARDAARLPERTPE
jgi:hypothetical protein